MILISHPRAGSDWFLSGLTEYDYTRWEIFGGLNDLQSSPYRNISFSAKLNMLRNVQPGRAHKLITFNFMAHAHEPDFPELIRELRRHDLYLLRRLNMQQTIISFLVAKINLNWHGDAELLKYARKATYKEILGFYTASMGDYTWIERAFDFKEKFVYEDLLSGAQRPTTIGWDPAKSPVKQRASAVNYSHLITNLDEVRGWLDDLRVPGSLDTAPGTAPAPLQPQP